MSRDGYGYATRAECNRDGEGPKNVQNVEFRIVGGLLKYTMTSLCSVVGKDMPDGFLNLRTGPGLRYDVKARLITGDELASVNAERKGKWIRVKVLRLGIVGWLDEKYTDGSEFDCSADAMAESQ
jgi:hypothetical protein